MLLSQNDSKHKRSGRNPGHSPGVIRYWDNCLEDSTLKIIIIRQYFDNNCHKTRYCLSDSYYSLYYRGLRPRLRPLRLVQPSRMLFNYIQTWVLLLFFYDNRDNGDNGLIVNSMLSVDNNKNNFYQPKGWLPLEIFWRVFCLRVLEDNRDVITTITTETTFLLQK